VWGELKMKLIIQEDMGRNSFITTYHVKDICMVDSDTIAYLVNSEYKCVESDERRIFHD